MYKTKANATRQPLSQLLDRWTPPLAQKMHAHQKYMYTTTKNTSPCQFAIGKRVYLAVPLVWVWCVLEGHPGGINRQEVEHRVPRRRRFSAVFVGLSCLPLRQVTSQLGFQHWPVREKCGLLSFVGAGHHGCGASGPPSTSARFDPQSKLFRQLQSGVGRSGDVFRLPCTRVTLPCTRYILQGYSFENDLFFPVLSVSYTHLTLPTIYSV